MLVSSLLVLAAALQRVLSLGEATLTAASLRPPAPRRFFIETHGCQMNLADSDIVRSILLSEGYEMSDDLETADLILTNTCAIRENAEEKIWHRLKFFQSIRKKHALSGAKPRGFPRIGVLGCMAERIKSRLIEEEGVDFVAGPDEYRSLPALLNSPNTDQNAAASVLALDETYADIAPVRLAEGEVVSARYCVRLSLTACREYARLRDHHPGLRQPLRLLRRALHPRTREESSGEHGAVGSVGVEGPGLPRSGAPGTGNETNSPGLHKLLASYISQNVNSYWDTSSVSEDRFRNRFQLAEGFVSRKNAVAVPGLEELGGGVRFGELLARVAEVDPEMRVRFQSPHPKDFGDDLLALIAATPNICKALHMPAQHGSSAVLDRMRRGYSREAYLGLVSRARSIIGKGIDNALGISTDMISGFCGETEEEHQVSLTHLQCEYFSYASHSGEHFVAEGGRL